MRTYYYSGETPHCGTDCSWRNCPSRYFAQLRKRDNLHDIKEFKTGYLLPQDLNETPKRGDIIILFISRVHDLDHMLQHRDRLEGLKKILVVQGPDSFEECKYYKLHPRYITQANRNIDEIEAVIQNMKRGRSP